MSLQTRSHHRHTGGYYGAFAFASVILTAFASFLVNQRYYMPAHWVPVVFLLGAIYASLGILAGRGDPSGQRWMMGYFVVQCLILTAMIFLSPVRGFMGIAVLPVMSQAIFCLSRRMATVIGLYLFAVVVLVWAHPYGIGGIGEAAMNYATAFGFTIAFTLTTKQALLAREREAGLRREVEAANQKLRDYAAQVDELATTRERNRVAREIHDGVGHYLTVVKTQLDAATALLPGDADRAREVVAKAARLTAEALDDVRRSVGALRTDVPRPPLPDAIRSLAEDAGVTVSVRIEGAARPLPPAVEHALFRSAQEGLTNIRKHAQASAAEVALDFSDTQRVRLAIRDNGRGAAATTGDGFGLQGIRERVELLGGRVDCGNSRDGGFAVAIEVPTVAAA